VKIFLGGLFVLVMAALVWGYPRRYGALSARSRLFRTSGLGLLLLLIAVALVQVSLPPLDGTRLTAFRHLAVYSTGIFLALSLACLAVLDALEVWSVMRREERARIQEMARPRGERSVE
jgi:hypothetical protein